MTPLSFFAMLLDMRNLFRFWMLVLAVVVGCSTTPDGRKQLKLIPDSTMDQMGDQSFAKLKQQETVIKNNSPANGAMIARVRCVTDRLLVSMGMNPKEWDVEIFKDDSPNAFAVPGKHVGVHTGMLNLVENNDQLAAVIGHEIGHVLAHHGNERASQTLVSQLGLAAAQIALGQDSKQDQLILAALGLGVQFGVLLPYSRAHEREADHLGVRYMADAGFDPRQAARLWELMQQKNPSSPPEILSTHPSSESRIKDLRAYAQQFEVKPAAACPK